MQPLSSSSYLAAIPLAFVSTWQSIAISICTSAIWLIVAATVLTQLIGSALLLSRRLCWLGAGVLAVFTAIATLIAHAFWDAQGLERVHQMATFFEHVAIIGGFAAVAILVNGPRSTP